MNGIRDQGHTLNEQTENHLEGHDPAVDHHGENQVFQRCRLFMMVAVFVFHNYFILPGARYITVQ
jgi:hypothetical protein